MIDLASLSPISAVKSFIGNSASDLNQKISESAQKIRTIGLEIIAYLGWMREGFSHYGFDLFYFKKFEDALEKRWFPLPTVRGTLKLLGRPGLEALNINEQAKVAEVLASIQSAGQSQFTIDVMHRLFGNNFCYFMEPEEIPHMLTRINQLVEFQGEKRVAYILGLFKHFHIDKELQKISMLALLMRAFSTDEQLLVQLGLSLLEADLCDLSTPVEREKLFTQIQLFKLVAALENYESGKRSSQRYSFSVEYKQRFVRECLENFSKGSVQDLLDVFFKSQTDEDQRSGAVIQTIIEAIKDLSLTSEVYVAVIEEAAKRTLSRWVEEQVEPTKETVIQQMKLMDAICKSCSKAKAAV